MARWTVYQLPAWAKQKLKWLETGPEKSALARPIPEVDEELTVVGSNPTLVDISTIGAPHANLPPSSKNASSKWLFYVLLLVAVILIFGVAVPHTSRVARSTQWAGAELSAPTYYVPPELDCVRVVSSVNSTVLAGALAELHRIGLRGEASVQTPLLDPENHKRGCHNAHVKAHQWAVDNGCKYTLVVEDDVVFARDMTAAWKSIDALFRSQRIIDTVWLGYVGIRLDETDTPGIVHLQKPMLAHAVIYSQDTSRRIVGLPPWRPQNLSILEAYDVALWHEGATRLGATFGVFPPAAAQLPSRPSSLSLDKNGVQDWVKSFVGMRVFASLSYKTCSGFYRLSPYLSAILGLFMTMPPDSLSLQSVYTCNTTTPLDYWD